MSITRQGSRLFAQLTGQPAVEIFASAEGEFFYKVVNARLTFEVNQARRTAVTLHQNGMAMRAVRVE